MENPVSESVFPLSALISAKGNGFWGGIDSAVSNRSREGTTSIFARRLLFGVEELAMTVFSAEIKDLSQSIGLLAGFGLSFNGVIP